MFLPGSYPALPNAFLLLKKTWQEQLEFISNASPTPSLSCLQEAAGTSPAAHGSIGSSVGNTPSIIWGPCVCVCVQTLNIPSANCLLPGHTVWVYVNTFFKNPSFPSGLLQMEKWIYYKFISPVPWLLVMLCYYKQHAILTLVQAAQCLEVWLPLEFPRVGAPGHGTRGPLPWPWCLSPRDWGEGSYHKQVDNEKERYDLLIFILLFRAPNHKVEIRVQRLFGSQDYSPVAPTPFPYPHRAGRRERCLSSFSKSWVQRPTPPLLLQKGLNSTLPLYRWDSFPRRIQIIKEPLNSVSTFSHARSCPDQERLWGPGRSAALPFRARLWPHTRQPGPAPLQPGPESGSVVLRVVNPAN